MKIINNILSVLLLLGITWHVHSQEIIADSIIPSNKLTLIKSFDIPELHLASIDRYNNIYVADTKGNLHRYSEEGVKQLTYSPGKKSDISSIEGWQYVNVFLFYRNFQEYVLLDRFLNFTPPIKLNEQQIGFARLMTNAQDNSFWVIDDSDFSLKKYNPQFNKIEINTPLSLLIDPGQYNLNYMRAYQNLLFVNDKNSGILVFDNLGNYKQKLNVKGIDYFNFYNDELYFISGTDLYFLNLYTGKVKKLTLGDTYKYALISDKSIVLLKPQKAEIFNKP